MSKRNDLTYEQFRERFQFDNTKDILGRGGYGVVYRAKDTHRNNRFVAIKRVEFEQEHTSLRRETELIQKLDIHPNIAYYEECYRFSTSHGVFDYAVLDYYEERNLLKHKKSLTIEQKKVILEQLLDGIQFLHDNKIIHRDLKPENILISRDKDKYIPIISDFGISKNIESVKNSYTNSLKIASLRYASPEQLDEERDSIDYNTDLWSFGIIALGLFLETFPFDLATLAKIKKGDLPPIDFLPKAWQMLIKECLKADPAERINNCEDCKRILSEYQDEAYIPKEPLVFNSKGSDKSQEDKTQTFSKNLSLIIVAILLGGLIPFVNNMTFPSKVLIKNQLFDYALVRYFTGFIPFIAYAVMGFPAGVLLERFGYKTTALIAIAVGFTGVFIQFLSLVIIVSTIDLFFIYLLGVLIASFSMCMLYTVVTPMLNRLGGGGNKGNQLLQLSGSFNSLINMLLPILLGYYAGAAASNSSLDINPLLFTVMGVFVIAGIGLFFTNVPETESIGKKVKRGNKYSSLKSRHFVLGAMGIFVYVGIEVSIPSVMNQWLSNPKLGIPPQLHVAENAGLIVGSFTWAYWLLMLIGRLIGAAIGRKVSAKSMLIVTSAAGLILIFIALLFAPALKQISSLYDIKDETSFFDSANLFACTILFILVGLCTSVMWGAIFNLAVEGLGKYTEKASGILMMMICGGAILPFLQIAILDLNGNTDYLISFWVVFAGLAYLLYYALFGSKNAAKAA